MQEDVPPAEGAVQQAVDSPLEGSRRRACGPGGLRHGGPVEGLGQENDVGPRDGLVIAARILVLGPVEVVQAPDSAPQPLEGLLGAKTLHVPGADYDVGGMRPLSTRDRAGREA